MTWDDATWSKLTPNGPNATKRRWFCQESPKGSCRLDSLQIQWHMVTHGDTWWHMVTHTHTRSCRHPRQVRQVHNTWFRRPRWELKVQRKATIVLVARKWWGTTHHHMMCHGMLMVIRNLGKYGKMGRIQFCTWNEMPFAATTRTPSLSFRSWWKPLFDTANACIRILCWYRLVSINRFSSFLDCPYDTLQPFALSICPYCGVSGPAATSLGRLGNSPGAFPTNPLVPLDPLVPFPSHRVHRQWAPSDLCSLPWSLALLWSEPWCPPAIQPHRIKRVGGSVGP